MTKSQNTQIKPLPFGISLGLVWGALLFITTLISYYTSYANLFLKVLAESIYPGYSISPIGSILGFIYGFLDGFICGTAIIFIYNKLVSANK